MVLAEIEGGAGSLAEIDVTRMCRDGAFHMEVEHREGDITREWRITRRGRVIVRCTAREVRDEPFELAADLRVLDLGALCA